MSLSLAARRHLQERFHVYNADRHFEMCVGSLMLYALLVDRVQVRMG